MDTTGKNMYEKPQMTVIEIELSRLLCVSDEFVINGFREDEDELDAI